MEMDNIDMEKMALGRDILKLDMHRIVHIVVFLHLKTANLKTNWKS